MPEDRIRNRYERTLRFLPAAIAQADRTVLFDNSVRRAPDSPVIMRWFVEIVRRSEDEVVIQRQPPIPKWGARLIAALEAA